MLKVYVLTFDAVAVSRQQVLDYLDTLAVVKNWLAFLPAAIFIVSDRSVHELQSLLVGHMGGGFFFLSEVPKGVNNGWLPNGNWEFINHPKSSGRWP